MPVGTQRIYRSAFVCSSTGELGPPDFPRCAVWQLAANGTVDIAATVDKQDYYQPVTFSCYNNEIFAQVRPVRRFGLNTRRPMADARGRGLIVRAPCSTH